MKPAAKSAKEDRYSGRLATRLRVIGNGDDNVNALRAQISCVVASTNSGEDEGMTPRGPTLMAAQAFDYSLEGVSPDRGKRALGKRPKLAARPKANNAFVNVFIEFLPEAVNGPEKPIEAMKKLIAASMKSTGRSRSISSAEVDNRNILSATVPVTMLPELARQPHVSFIYSSEPLKFSTPASALAAKPEPRRVRDFASKHKDGEGVIIGIIDVGGFDFSHPDFLDVNGGTRFLNIWDQGGTFRKPPARYGYGAEITKQRMDAALAAEAKGGLPARFLEKQSQMQPGSHGTHVASIAAGKSGVCPKAMLAAVLLDIPSADSQFEQRRSTFVDSSRIAHAVDYLVNLANAGKKPLSINISLGTNGGSHDGANGICRWIDSTLATPGRSICVAAGNAGQEDAASEDDLGFIMGRIHTLGRIPSRGLDVDLDWVVVGDGVEDFSENEMEIWYGAQDRISVSVQPPGQDNWYTAQPREFFENKRLADGTVLSVYNELYHPANGANYISIYLSPNLEEGNLRGILPGIWRVRLSGGEIRDGRFNAWIERDDPGDVGRDGGRRIMAFPSFFSAKTNVDSHSINSLACAHWVIAVANLDSNNRRINITSSQGPTRDNRGKPDIAAPGTDIAAAKGFAGADDRWISMSGTSMSSPYVCGVVGLMMAANPELTSAQCGGILQRTARPLPGSGYEWRNDSGFGQIDPKEAIGEAISFMTRISR